MILYTVYFVIFSASTKYRLLSLSQAITTPRLGVQRVRFLSVESSPCLYLVLIWPDLCHCALKRRFGEIWRARSLMHGWRTQSSSRELRRLINDWSMHINAASQTLRTELIIRIYIYITSQNRILQHPHGLSQMWCSCAADLAWLLQQPGHTVGIHWFEDCGGKPASVQIYLKHLRISKAFYWCAVKS